MPVIEQEATAACPSTARPSATVADSQVTFCNKREYSSNRLLTPAGQQGEDAVFSADPPTGLGTGVPYFRPALGVPFEF